MMINSLKPYISHSEFFSGNKHLYFLNVEVAQQKEIASFMKKNEGVLLTEWVSPNNKLNTINWFTFYLLPTEGLYCIQSVLHKKFPRLLDLSQEYPVCYRLQRAIYELTRISTKNTKDKRFWLNHGYFPLGVLNQNSKLKLSPSSHYAFKKVTGEGVHEIPVGPVHAGIIEPGHFRFSVVGERILKLEERLGYTHKGIHQLLRNKSIEEAAKLIGRVSGDSTVAYAYAFAKACEQAKHYCVNENVMMERNICLERERLCNHIGDIGAIINDAGLPSLQASFNCLKEQLLRYNAKYFGHRYLMDCIKPFTEKLLLITSHLQIMKLELIELEENLLRLEEIVNQHLGLQDRIQNTGIISMKLAKDLGLLGVVSKASGVDYDIRRLLPSTVYDTTFISSCNMTAGDVAARVAVRFKENFESIKLIQKLIETLCDTKDNIYKEQKFSSSNHEINMGIGVVEGWRGPISVIVSMDENHLDWCHFHDPSWQNWLALEYAVMDNIVADFPLINKSLNLSYSGHDS